MMKKKKHAPRAAAKKQMMPMSGGSPMGMGMPTSGGMMKSGGPVGTGGMRNPNKVATCKSCNQ